MLMDVMTGNAITSIPRSRLNDWKIIETRLAVELPAIKATLNEMIDGSEIHTAGWMPGSDWRGTPFQAIFEKAAERNYALAGKYFGLIVWVVFMERPERWATGRFEKDGEPIGSRTYFRVD